MIRQKALFLICFLVLSAVGMAKPKYKDINYPTPNFDPNKTNLVKGVILHHTAEPTIGRSLGVLTNTRKKVGTHVVIDTDGTRYRMCSHTGRGASLRNRKALSECI